MRLPTLDRYLLRQLAPPFAVALATMLIALLLERLLLLLDHLAYAGSSLATLVSLLTDLLPHYMGLALPAALCVAVFVTIHRMSDHNEIDVLCAGHVSLLRISIPYMKVGLLLGALSILLYGYIQPVARYDYRAGFYFAEHTGWAPHLQSGMFATTSSKAVMTADRVTRGGTKLRHVFIREMKSEGGAQLVTAINGELTISPRTQSTRLDLWNGEIVNSPRPGSLKDNPTVTHFEHVVRIIDQPMKKMVFRSRGEDERELTMVELARALRHGLPGIPYRVLRAELDFRLARAIAIPFIPLLAVSFAVGRKRRQSALGQIIMAAILVGFDEILLFGHSFAAAGTAPVWLSIWVPEGIFCIGCLLALFVRSQLAWRKTKSARHAPTASA